MPAGCSDPRDSPLHTHSSGPLLWWEKTCCCLSHLRSTSHRPFSPARCNPRLDPFSRFEVNQLQIPLASYRGKIKNRRLHVEAWSQVQLLRLARRYQWFPLPPRIRAFSGKTDQMGPVPETSLPLRKLSEWTPNAHHRLLFFFFFFFLLWKDVEFETPVHYVPAALRTFPRRTQAV